MTLHEHGPVALFTDYDKASETGAVALLQHVVYQLAGLRPEVPVFAIPPGPHFVYELGPQLFSGRHGSGPLRVALDTNLLIDYFQYGRVIWAGDSMPELADGSYGEELEAFQIILALWVLRDIRFHVLRGSLSDARRLLSSERERERRRAFRSFRDAVELVGDSGSGHRMDAPIVVPGSVVEQLLRALPAGGDRGLVREALVSNAGLPA